MVTIKACEGLLSPFSPTNQWGRGLIFITHLSNMKQNPNVTWTWVIYNWFSFRDPDFMASYTKSWKYTLGSFSSPFYKKFKNGFFFLACQALNGSSYLYNFFGWISQKHLSYNYNTHTHTLKRTLIWSSDETYSWNLHVFFLLWFMEDILGMPKPKPNHHLSCLPGPILFEEMMALMVAPHFFMFQNCVRLAVFAIGGNLCKSYFISKNMKLFEWDFVEIERFSSLTFEKHVWKWDA